MEVKILHKRSNPLLCRTELCLSIDHEGASTPRRSEIKSKIVEELAREGASPKKDTILVFNCHTPFGRARTRALAHIYKSVEDLQEIERRFVTERLNREKGITTEKRPGRKVRKEAKNKRNKLRGTAIARLRKQQRKERRRA